MPVKVHVAETVPDTDSVNVKVFPDIDPAPDTVYEFPHPSTKVDAGKVTLFPLAVPEKVILFTHPEPPTVPVVLTVFPLAVRTKLAVPLPQLDVPVHVPPNFTPSVPPLSDFFVHEETAISANEKTNANTMIWLLKIPCNLFVIFMLFYSFCKTITF